MPLNMSTEGIERAARAFVNAGQSYTFQPQASDAAGKALTFAILNCPTWASFSTSTGKLSGTPTAAQVGAYTNIDISVSDGTTNVELPVFSITVTASTPDMPSTIGGTPPTSVIAGQAYSFQPTASDPAGKTLTFSIAHAPSWATFNTTTGALSGTPTAAQAGVYSNIVITASNGTSRAALTAFAITMTAPPPPDAPVISGAPATSGGRGTDVQLSTDRQRSGFQDVDVFHRQCAELGGLQSRDGTALRHTHSG